MPTFSGNRGGTYTPNASSDHWILEADATGEFGKVVSIGWGGRMTTSTGYRTRWFRPTTTASGTSTSLSQQGANGLYGTPLLSFKHYNTGTPATAPSDPINLHAQDWNAHGGLGYVVLPLANPWWVSGANTTNNQIASRNVAGTDADVTSYSCVWEE